MKQIQTDIPEIKNSIDCVVCVRMSHGKERTSDLQDGIEVGNHEKKDFLKIARKGWPDSSADESAC